jgi:hypothetical protein
MVFVQGLCVEMVYLGTNHVLTWCVLQGNHYGIVGLGGLLLMVLAFANAKNL